MFKHIYKNKMKQLLRLLIVEFEIYMLQPTFEPIILVYEVGNFTSTL